ncbi:short-chain dehydrogenase [Candidatus Poribacteria bacterium]|nr:MAG: short-chain dehydrogenase [Candidatus Poribacteria bacterium]
MKHPSVKDLFSVEGQVAFVTGGGRGIGKVFCLTLAEAGADVAVIDIDPETASQTAKEIEAMGRRALAIKADVTKPDEVERAVQQTVERFGRIDILVNNAGICIHENAENMTDEQWDAVMDVNLKGVFNCCRAVGRVMIKQGGGKIINVASMSALIVNRPQNQVAYNASKAGVVMLTKSLAVEWAQYGIRVNAISPGYTLTEMTKKVSHLFPVWKPMIPMGRLCEPEELRGALLFLASDASSYVTGHNLVVDGGYTLI